MMARNRPNFPLARSSRQKKLFATVLIGLLGILCLVGGFFAGIRYLIQGPEFKRILISRLKTPLTTEASIDQLSFRWTSLSSAQIESTGVRIGQADRDPIEISFSRMEMSLDLQGVIFGNLGIDFLKVTNPQIIIDSGSLKSKLAGAPAGSSIQLPLKPSIKSLRITDATILNKRAGASRNSYETLFSRIEISAGNLSVTGVERFEAQGLSHDGSKTGRLEMSGNLGASQEEEDIDGKKSFIKFRLLDYPTYPVSHLITSFYPEIPILKGIANAHIQIRGRWDDWNAIGSFEIANFLHPAGKQRIRGNSDRLYASVEGFRKANRIKISVPSISAPGIDASVETNFEDLGSENAYATVNVRKADINLDEAIKIAPLKLLSAPDQERILKAGIKGGIRILSASWNYRFNVRKKPAHFWTDTYLDATLNQVTGFIPGFELPIENASGAFRLNSNEVLFKGINVTIGSSPVVINGWMNNLSVKPRMDLFISMKAQASDVLNVLTSKAWGERFEPYLKWIQEPGGSVSVTMDLKGDLEKPTMKGQIDLDEFGFKTESAASPIRKVSGRLRFRPSSISTSAIKGFLGDSPFELKGTFSDKESHASIDMKLNGADLRKLYFHNSGWSIAGIAPLTVNIKGRFPEIGFSGNLDLKNLIVAKESWIRKAAGVPLKLEFSGVKDAEGVTVEDAYLVSDTSRIFTRAQIRDDGKISASLNLPPKGIPTGDLMWIVDPALELQPGGRIEGDLILRKDRNQDPNIDANFTLNHVSLRLPRARKRTDGITGSIQLKGKTLQFNVERSRTGSSVVAADLLITDFSQPKYKASFDCEFLDTTDFTDQSGQAPVMSWIDWIRSNSVIRFLNYSRGSFSLHVAKGKTAYRTFSDFRADFDGNNGMLNVPKWQMNFADGILRGTASFDLRPHTTRPLRVEFQGDQLKFDRIFLSDPNRARVDGDVVSQGYMEWRIRSGLENGGIYKSGNMEVRVADGTIYRFEVLSKIFSLINLGSILRGRLPDIIGQGLSFQRMNWKMDVFDNKWKIKNLKFYSDAARIDASGMYFSDQGRIDFKVDVAPLVGFDTIVSGLFGNLITRDGKILNTTFRVRGLTSSPDVRLEPFENLKQDLRQGG